MIHKNKVLNKDTGVTSIEYTSDREDCKVIVVDGKPKEVKMDIDERRNRRDGQSVGKFKQKGVSKDQKKNERKRDERMSNKKDIEERLGEYVDRVLSTPDVSEEKLSNLTNSKPSSVLDKINSYLSEKEKKKDDEDEDIDTDGVEIEKDPKAIDKLSKEEKDIVNKMKKSIEDNKDNIEGDEDDENEDDEGEDAEDSDEVEDTEDEEANDDQEVATDDEEEDSEEDAEVDDTEVDDTEEEEPENPEDGNLNDDPDEVEEKAPIEADNEVAELTRDEEYDIESNNAYDYYEFLLSKTNEESLITKINSAYIKIPKEKRKLSPASQLLGFINDIIESDETSGPMGGLGGDIGGDIGGNSDGEDESGI